MVSPVFFIALPLATAFLIVLIGRTGPAKTLAVIASAALVGLALSWIFPAVSSTAVVRLGGVDAPLGIGLALDRLGAGLALVVAVSLLLVTVYSLGYIPAGARAHAERAGAEQSRAGHAEAAPAHAAVPPARIKRPDELRYYAVLMLLAASSFGLLLTRDLFNLFVFYEVLCISSYILVAFEQDDRALEASMKYMLLGSVGSLLMLLSIGLAYRVTGSLAMDDVATALAAAPAPYTLITALLFLFGMGLEGAIFPVNTWLPDAHSSAPSSISAILSGFVIELALIVLFRIGMTVFASVNLLSLLQILAIAGIVVGEMAAWAQTELKRTLAYSSIGQIGIILFALSLGSQLGGQAALGHLLMHTGAKSVLFLVAGYFIVRTGSHEITRYRGLAKRMPISSVLFTLAALSLLGAPPFLGFFTKFRVIAAAGAAPFMGTAGLAITWLGIVAILFGTVLEGAYLVRIVRTLFDGTPEEAFAAGEGRVAHEAREGVEPVVDTGGTVASGRTEMDAPGLVAVALFTALLVFGALALPAIDGVVNPAASALVSLF
jgi:formate hydrogenlyase subunit 3/multisubunit Na+/H+ antiporter MnhD subunit